MIGLITGLGLMASILFIRFDDSRNIIAIFLQLIIYLTPVFYPKSILEGYVGVIVSLNPLTSYLDIFRSVFTNTGMASTYDWIYMFGSSVTSIIVGIYVFERYWNRTAGML
jgi:ABC-type polysaccharide/polyol phosphate export permease